MAETKIDKAERKTLTPTWVGEPTQLPNSQVKVLRFSADNGLQFETFKASLFPYIQLGQPIDADTELRITTTEQGTQYPHWRIVQLYKEGKPISSEKGQQQYKGRDENRTDIRAAILEIGQDYRAGLLKADNPRVIAYYTWIDTIALPHLIISPPTGTAVLPQEKKQTKPYDWRTEKEMPPSPLDRKQPKIEPPATTEPQTFPLLRAWAISLNKNYTLSWMVNSVKIPEAELRADPNGSYHKIKEFLGKEG